ncbi:hypothetical protein BU25DRAFT_413169 [Macroventuria anomochaeta]|uniref:Uncharacterized protein n=1 Tax=Macroventuria anomochaeta TaxID=301207 RepID=A0ACB6RSP6_9PLEO|nr:uncharacterized protein BU25DRAFT_413169 [Macroventuria anomochaeta]KAF2625010.1 hypothetical protein BU25DRAFT_413169 [Macroventuria anomochaeta]
MPEGKFERHKRKGLGYNKVKQDGQVTVEDGVVMLRRGKEDTTIESSVEVKDGDTIYWTADCTYTQRAYLLQKTQ